ncbi:MAG: hypothetical protein ACK4E4_06765 [Rhodocyclaceae bacterium]
MIESLYRYWIEEPLADIRRWPGGVWTFAALAAAALAVHIATDGALPFLIVVGALAIGWLFRLAGVLLDIVRWLLFIR